MAHSLSVEEGDSLEPIRRELHEAGAKKHSPLTLFDLSSPAEPCALVMTDLSTACDMTAAELNIARDATFAHMLARQDTKRVSEEPSCIKCSICLEMTPIVDRFQSSKCGHSFCKPCMRQHLEIIATETHIYPLVCPQCQATVRGSAVELDAQDCLAVMVGTGEVYNTFERFLLERQHFSRMRYCTNAACSMPFDWEDDPELQGQFSEFRVTCPSCGHITCVKCKVQWHVGRTCEQYVAEKDGTYAFEKLAQRKAWKACPRCTSMIERQQGDCNFVKCRCGCGFCHKCGTEYRSLGRTSNNSHGRPNCNCGLFSYRMQPIADDSDQEDDGVIGNFAFDHPVHHPPFLTRLRALLAYFWRRDRAR